MNDLVYVGKIVNTHGIRGEVRLLSNFSYKNRAFRVGGHIYIGRDKIMETITGYRVHKCFDMITLEGYSNINEVLRYKGALCYVRRGDLQLSENEFLDEDLIDMIVEIDGVSCGYVLRLEEITERNKVMWIRYEGKEVAIPFVSEFVRIDFMNKKVAVKPIDGLLK